MNGMAFDTWPYVIAAFAITWLVLIGYSIHLARASKRARLYLTGSGPDA
jgi:CcmD family protein